MMSTAPYLNLIRQRQIKTQHSLCFTLLDAGRNIATPLSQRTGTRLKMNGNSIRDYAVKGMCRDVNREYL